MPKNIVRGADRMEKGLSSIVPEGWELHPKKGFRLIGQHPSQRYRER